MKRRIILFLCLLILALPCHVFAAQQLVIDDADVLSGSELSELQEQAENLSHAYNMDIVIVTVADFYGYDCFDYTEEYYLYHNYDDDGIILLLSMAERDWAMVAFGDAQYVLRDSDMDRVFSRISDDLSQDRYAKAFEGYLDCLEDHFREYEDRGGAEYYHSFRFKHFLIALVAGLIVALVALLIMRNKMNTAKAQRSAGSYIAEGSYALHPHRDRFLYSHVSKVRRQQDNSHGRSGGSGRSGKF